MGLETVKNSRKIVWNLANRVPPNPITDGLMETMMIMMVLLGISFVSFLYLLLFLYSHFVLFPVPPRTAEGLVHCTTCQLRDVPGERT